MASSSREIKKINAIARAQKRLEQRLEMIDWEIDYLTPFLEAHKAVEAAGNKLSVELEAGSETDPEA